MKNLLKQLNKLRLVRECSRWIFPDSFCKKKYVKNGVDTYFTIVVTNEDPGSATGKQVVQVLGCNIDSADIAKLDVDAEILDQDIDFTFNDFNVLESFNALN